MNRSKRIVITCDHHHHAYAFPSTTLRIERCIDVLKCLMNYIGNDEWWVLGDFFQTITPDYALMNSMLNVLKVRVWADGGDKKSGVLIAGNHDQVLPYYASPLTTLGYSDRISFASSEHIEEVVETALCGVYCGSNWLSYYRKADDFLKVMKELLLKFPSDLKTCVIACHQYFSLVAPFTGSEVINIDDIRKVIKETGFKHKIYFVSGHYHLRSYQDFGEFAIIYPGCLIDNNFGECGFPVGGVNLILEEEPYFEFFNLDEEYVDAGIARFVTASIEDFMHEFCSEKNGPDIDYEMVNYFKLEIPAGLDNKQVDQYRKQLVKFRERGWHIKDVIVGRKQEKQRDSIPQRINIGTEQVIQQVVDELSIPAEFDQKLLVEKGKELIK